MEPMGLTTVPQRLQIKPVQPVITRHKAINWGATLNGLSPSVSLPWFAAVPLLVLCLAAVFAAMLSCGADAPVKPAGVDHYTCTMHPSVKLQNPAAKCPICGMDLVAVLKRGAEAAPGEGLNDSAPGEFTVPGNRQQQIGVTYAPVAKGPLIQKIRGVGRVAFDK